MESKQPFKLVYYRVVFSVFMIIEVYRYLSKGWVTEYWIHPVFLFNYPGFEFLEVLPGNGMIYLFYGMGLLAFCVLIGLFTRLSSLLLALAFSYQFLLEQTYYLNHFYLILLLSWINVFLPLNRFYSLDAKLFGTRSQVNIRLYEFILQAQITIVYVYAGIAKINSDWLAGEPMRGWLAARTDFPFLGSYFLEPQVVDAFCYGGLLFDLFIVPIIIWKRTRYLGLLMMILFHITNHFLFHIGIFPWLMILLTPLLLPDPVLKNKLKLQSSLPRVHMPALYLAIFYLTFQVLFPLRHYLYEGNVSWTEQGHKFAWHMKLRTKKCSAVFFVQMSPDRPRIQIDNFLFLTERQDRKMSARPYMIRDFARYLRQQFSSQSNDQAKVVVWSHCSLNGRAYQHFIDPTVDISRVNYHFGLDRESWIIPLNTPLPRANRFYYQR